ncbi:hypothetical protein ACB092_11G073500 [Castanea dentata]
MVMGNNAGVRNDGTGCSGAKNLEDNHDHLMDSTQGYGMVPMPIVHCPPHNHIAYQPPFIFNPEVLVTPMPTLRQFMQSQVHALPQSTINSKEELIGKLISVKITWNYGGNSVGLVGSWSNWQIMEFLEHAVKNATVTMALPVGIHYYCFIVDGVLTYASNLDWICDNYGDHYNILYLQEDVLQAPSKGFANLSDFESPPSPPSSYDNKFFTDKDFYYRTKEGNICEIQPPELPPQLEEAILDMPSSSFDVYHSLPRPQFSQVNHLYGHKENEDQYVIVSSTERFADKYITTILYKPAFKTKPP